MKRRKKKHPLVQVVIPSRSLAQVAPAGGQSDVARIRAQIAAEQESAQRALYSSAYGTTQHKFITRRMERMGMLQEELTQLVGEDDAALIIVEAMGAEAVSTEEKDKAEEDKAP